MYLLARGYRFVAYDLRTPPAQVDLLVRRGELLVVVEVKTRRGKFDDVFVRRQQAARLAHAGEWLLSRRGAGAAFVRVDVVTVMIPRDFPWWPRIRHFPGAVEHDGRSRDGA